MFSVFLSAVFTPMRNLTLDPPPMSPDDGWKEIHF
jgi:hypothetical protein